MEAIDLFHAQTGWQTGASREGEREGGRERLRGDLK